MVTIDEIIRTKRRSTALIIERDGRLVVRAPLHASTESIRRMVSKKEDWILRKQAYIKTTYEPFVPKEYVNGERFWYLGKIHRLELEDESRPALVLNGNFHLARTALPRASIIFEHWYREQAQRVFSERVDWYAAKHGFDYGRIRITSARQRWGSCSTKGTVSFTWRLVMGPLPIIDYVVLHELVHLQVMNHSREFWGKVRTIMPDYEQRIEWLELNGHLLRLG